MKMYWILEKINGTPAVCSSLVAVSKTTFINYSTLIYHFSRMKRNEYEDDRFRIAKTKLIRSKRNG